MQGTSYTIEPLLSLLQDDSFTEFGEAILKGNANLRDKSLNPLQLLVFKELKQQTNLPASSLQPKISIEHMSDCYRNWKEQTSTSPSLRYLGLLYQLKSIS